MKKLLKKLCCGALLVSAILTLSTTPAAAAQVAATYTYNSSGNIASVSNESSATYAYVSPGIAKSSSYKSISADTTSGGVTYYTSSRSDNTYYYRYYLTGAFTNCSNLKQIIIEDGVTELPYGAFFEATNVDTIVFPQNNWTYYASTSSASTEYEIGGSSESRRYYYYYYYNTPTFGLMTGLSKYYCSSSHLITLPYGTRVTYDYNDGQLLYKLSNGTYTVLYALPGIESVSIPDTIDGVSVTAISDSAFTSNTSLKTLTIPSTVTTIGSSAFKDCVDLTSVRIPSSVTSIGSYAFYNCDSITSVSIPTYIETIGTAAFSNCDSLTSITVNNANTYFSAEDNVLYDYDKTRLISYAGGKTDDEYIIPETVTTIDADAATGISASTVIVPENIATIGSNAFITDNSAFTIICAAGTVAADDDIYPNGTAIVTLTTNSTTGTYTVKDVISPTNLTELEIPKYYYNYACTVIGASAFSGCSALTSVTIPNTVDTIESEAFISCTSLNNIDIPSGVEEIGEAAFSGCLALDTIAIAPTVTTIGDDCFYNCPAMTVTCEEGSTADNSSIYTTGTTFSYTEYIILGDINDDGYINAADAVMALRYALSDGIELSEAQLRAGDVDGDGDVDSSDAQMIVDYDTGIVAAF